MDKKERILQSIQQIHSVTKLIDDIDYNGYMGSKLIMVQVELERQLTNLIHNERRAIQGSNQQYLDASEQQRSQFSDFAGTD
jgi:RNA binding exosome subunit